MSIQSYNYNYNIDSDIGTEKFWCGKIQTDFIIEAGQTGLRKEYREIFEYAEDNALIVSDEDWLNNKMYGFFSYGDGKTTLRFPDKRGLSLVGFEENYHSQPGTYIEDQIVNIKGDSVFRWGCLYRCSGAFNVFSQVKGVAGVGGSDVTFTTADFDASRVVKTGERVQTRAITGNWVIKYK